MNWPWLNTDVVYLSAAVDGLDIAPVLSLGIEMEIVACFNVRINKNEKF